MIRIYRSERARQPLQIKRVVERRVIVVVLGVPAHRPVETIRLAGADS
jgi:hypothetical protein